MRRRLRGGLSTGRGTVHRAPGLDVARLGCQQGAGGSWTWSRKGRERGRQLPCKKEKSGERTRTSDLGVMTAALVCDVRIRRTAGVEHRPGPWVTAWPSQRYERPCEARTCIGSSQTPGTADRQDSTVPHSGRRAHLAAAHPLGNWGPRAISLLDSGSDYWKGNGSSTCT